MFPAEKILKKCMFPVEKILKKCRKPAILILRMPDPTEEARHACIL